MILTNSDERCLFRSIVISNNSDLQSIPRDKNGLLLDPVLKVQLKADMLKTNMVQHLLNNVRDFRQFEPAVNSDVPSLYGHTFCSMEKRIYHRMSSATASVGEMELAAKAHVLKQPIHVVHSEDGHVVKYCDADFSAAAPVTVLYSAFGDKAGHYDCLIPSSVSVAVISPFHFTQPQVSKRLGKRTEAEVLTSSPYKSKLIA